MAAAKKTKKKRAKGNRRHRATPERISAELGVRIRRMRTELGFTFDEFVGVSELGRGFVSELERGLAAPTVVTLCRIAAALEVSLVDLVAGVGPNAERWSHIVDRGSKLSPELLQQLREHVDQLSASPTIEEQ